MRTYRPVGGRGILAGAVEVSHSVVVGVGVPCGRGQVERSTGHWQRHGGVGTGHGRTFNWLKKRKCVKISVWLGEKPPPGDL